jgi:hypothetical protein
LPAAKHVKQLERGYGTEIATQRVITTENCGDHCATPSSAVWRVESSGWSNSSSGPNCVCVSEFATPNCSVLSGTFTLKYDPNLSYPCGWSSYAAGDHLVDVCGQNETEANEVGGYPVFAWVYSSPDWYLFVTESQSLAICPSLAGGVLYSIADSAVPCEIGTPFAVPFNAIYGTQYCNYPATVTMTRIS